MQVLHNFTADSAVFDDDNLVSLAGLVPVMALAEQTALSELLADKVHIAEPRIKSGSANPAPKLVTVIAGMCAGADSIDDVDVVRSGGMKTLFGDVYAPSTIGTLLREFSFGHARQLESVLRHHLAGLGDRVDLLPGGDVRAFVDIDSLLRPVYGHAKQGASYGHTKIAGKQLLRKGLSPLAATISTDTAAPVIAGMRLRAGRSGSGKFKGFRFPPEIISHCVWLYHRFPLSLRDVQELMLERGVDVSCETIRAWCDRFGQEYANQLRRRGRRPGDKWHLDEVFVQINGAQRYLWRAVDQHANVLDILVGSRRNAVAAKKFFRRLLTGLR